MMRREGSAGSIRAHGRVPWIAPEPFGLVPEQVELRAPDRVERILDEKGHLAAAAAVSPGTRHARRDDAVDVSDGAMKLLRDDVVRADQIQEAPDFGARADARRTRERGRNGRRGGWAAGGRAMCDRADIDTR